MSGKTWGVDIGATGIKAVELSRTWQGYRVTSYGFFPIPTRQKEEHRNQRLEALRKVFPQGKEGGEGLILPIASHRTMVHQVSLPFRERKKNRRVVKYEVEPLLPLPIDQVVVDFYTPQENGDRNGTIVFAVPKEELNEKLSLMQEAGLDPEGVVSEAMALFWLMKYLKLGASTSALLDVGHEKTTLIVWRGETLTLVRSIPVAGETLSHDIPASLGRLADEVQRTLIVYGSGPEGRPVEDIFLTGGFAAWPGIQEILNGLLKRPVAVLNLEDHAPSLLRDVPKEYHNNLAVALGAALWGSVREAERINFRQEEFVSSKKARKLKSRLNLLRLYLAILAFLGVAAFSTDLYLKEKRYRDLKAEIRKEFLQAQPGVKKVVNEVPQMKQWVQEEKARLDALSGFASTSSPLEVLREMSTLMEPAWKVRVTELVLDPEAVEVNGEADSFETVNRLKSKLDRSSLYKEVQLKTARASTLENVVEFKLQMKRGG